MLPLCFAVVAASASAQIASLGSTCPVQAGFTSLSFSSGAPGPVVPLAGTTVWVQQDTVISLNWNVWNILVIGFSGGSGVLPSCGCTLFPALDVLLVTPMSPQSIGLSWQSWTPLLLPSGAVGMTFFVQGVGVQVYNVPSWVPSCTESPLGLVLSPGYSVQVQ